MGPYSYLWRFHLPNAVSALGRPIARKITSSNCWSEDVLSFVPVAVLTPIIIYSVFLPTEEVALFNNMRIPAALLALVATVVTGRVIVTIVVGMASLWALEYLF